MFGIAKIGGLAAAAALVAVTTLSPASAQTPVNWTGFYLGADFGAALASNKATWVPEPAPPTPFGVDIQSHTNTGGNIFGGAHAGYMWQFAPRWIGGAEVDWAWSGATGSFNDPWTLGGVSTGPGEFTVMRSRLDWLSSARARVGYLVMPNLAIYGTGGLAVGSLDYHANNTNGASYATALSTSRIQLGFAAGIGAEWAIAAHWRLRAEYLFYQLQGGPNRLLFSLPSYPTTYPSRYSWSATDVSAARIGVSYKF